MKIYQLGIGSFFIIAALCILCFDLKKTKFNIANFGNENQPTLEVKTGQLWK